MAEFMRTIATYYVPITAAVIFMAAAIALFKYIIPRMEKRISKLEENLGKSHERIDDMSQEQSGFVAQISCGAMRDECQRFLCGKIESVKDVVAEGFKSIHNKIEEMNEKRERAKDKINKELAGVKTEVAKIQGYNTKQVVEEIRDAVRDELRNGINKD